MAHTSSNPQMLNILKC